MKRCVHYLLVYTCQGNLRQSLKGCTVICNKEIIKISELGHKIKFAPCLCKRDIALKALKRPVLNILSKIYKIFIIAHLFYIRIQTNIIRQQPSVFVFQKPSVIIGGSGPRQVIASFSEFPYPVYILFLKMVKIKFPFSLPAQYISILYTFAKPSFCLNIKVECRVSRVRYCPEETIVKLKTPEF